MDKKVILMILDGWGISPDPKVSAIDQANTPFIDSLYTKFPHTTLNTSGEAVGLPDGQMGNSEVGHQNIGAGRIVYQMLTRINIAVREKEIDQNKVYLDALDYAKKNGKNVHLIGLVSDGGVHSHVEHVKALCSIANNNGVKNVFIHAFTDGRDTDPESGLGFMTDLQNHLDKTTGKIASVTGRYFAMDRDKRWERVKLAYDAMVKGIGNKMQNPLEGIKASYNEKVTDEFIKPIIATDAAGNPLATIQEGDVVLCFNFRTDRGREITLALTQQAFPEQDMKPLDLYYVTMTLYDETFKGVKIMFENQNLSMTLGEVLAKNGKKQIRIAETEKYPHVTFFFSGGEENVFAGESRIMAQSPKVATYDLQPEMSAGELTEKIIPEIKAQNADFICLNFANADMVGHTGVFSAAVAACEAVDKCVSQIIPEALEAGYATLVIADHGNSDCMINPDGSPNTAHTTNPVPFILVDKDYKGSVKAGKLGDLAPTILTLMELSIPKEMTGEVLVG